MSRLAARPLAEITADALRATCGHCWAYPGEPRKGTPGIHLPRYGRARRRGLLSSADMTAVLAAVIASLAPAAVTPRMSRERVT